MYPTGRHRGVPIGYTPQGTPLGGTLWDPLQFRGVGPPFLRGTRDHDVHIMVRVSDPSLLGNSDRVGESSVLLTSLPVFSVRRESGKTARQQS